MVLIIGFEAKLTQVLAWQFMKVKTSLYCIWSRRMVQLSQEFYCYLLRTPGAGHMMWHFEFLSPHTLPLSHLQLSLHLPKNTSLHIQMPF